MASSVGRGKNENVQLAILDIVGREAGDGFGAGSRCVQAVA